MNEFRTISFHNGLIGNVFKATVVSRLNDSSGPGSIDS